MVIFNIKSIYPDKIINEIPCFPDGKIFDKNNKKELYISLLETDNMNNLVTKAVKRSIIDIDADYSEYRTVRNAEDLMQNIPLVIRVDKVVCISDCLYCYRRGTGMTAVLKADMVSSVAQSGFKVVELFEKQKDVDLSQHIEIFLSRYMDNFAKYIFYGYSDNPAKLKESFEWVREYTFYKRARAYIDNARIASKTAVFLAEHNCYFAIAVISKLLQIRLRIKKCGIKMKGDFLL